MPLCPLFTCDILDRIPTKADTLPTGARFLAESLDKRVLDWLTADCRTLHKLQEAAQAYRGAIAALADMPDAEITRQGMRDAFAAHVMAILNADVMATEKERRFFAGVASDAAPSDGVMKLVDF